MLNSITAWCKNFARKENRGFDLEKYFSQMLSNALLSNSHSTQNMANGWPTFEIKNKIAPKWDKRWKWITLKGKLYQNYCNVWTMWFNHKPSHRPWLTVRLKIISFLLAFLYPIENTATLLIISTPPYTIMHLQWVSTVDIRA